MVKNFKILMAVAIAAVAGYSVYTSQKNDIEMSDLAMENVEALADCEITKKGKVVLKCTGTGSCSATYLGYTLTCDGRKN